MAFPTLGSGWAATQVAVGSGHACAIVNGGKNIVCWGDNTAGQLGDGTTVSLSTSPRVVEFPCALGSSYRQQGLTPGVGACAGNVAWDARDSLCAGSCSACSTSQFIGAALASNFTPGYDYWTSDYLYYSGTGPNNCAADDNGLGTWPGPTPMRVCVANTTTDPLGNVCDWYNCGLNGPGIDEYFGGPGTGFGHDQTAGTLCCCP
jgi:hypothetical protein